MVLSLLTNAVVSNRLNNNDCWSDTRDFIDILSNDNDIFIVVKRM